MQFRGYTDGAAHVVSSGAPLTINELVITKGHRNKISACRGRGDSTWVHATTEQVLARLGILREDVVRHGEKWVRYSVPTQVIAGGGYDNVIPFETEVQQAH